MWRMSVVAVALALALPVPAFASCAPPGITVIPREVRAGRSVTVHLLGGAGFRCNDTPPDPSASPSPSSPPTVKPVQVQIYLTAGSERIELGSLTQDDYAASGTFTVPASVHSGVWSVRSSTGFATSLQVVDKSSLPRTGGRTAQFGGLALWLLVAGALLLAVGAKRLPRA